MKKALLISMIIFSVLAIGCGNTKDKTEKKEDAKNNVEKTKQDGLQEDNNTIVLVGEAESQMFANSNPTITLMKTEKRFSFCLSPLSSYMPMGMYEIKDNELILTTDNDPKNPKYVFKIEGDKYIFDAKKSAEVPAIKTTAKGKAETTVPDGMVFREQ